MKYQEMIKEIMNNTEYHEEIHSCTCCSSQVFYEEDVKLMIKEALIRCDEIENIVRIK